ncbi:MAG: TSUP family transporter, partial [Magnetococcales bacterium]|nr:TSUP family transporter [Magnetococcales bacterium]
MDHRPLPKVNAPFCRQNWRIPAIALGLVWIALFAWAIHLVRDHLDELGTIGLDFAKTQRLASAVASGQTVALINDPIDQRVRAATINVAGVVRDPATGAESFVSRGAGVLVDPRGNAATAFHVVDGLQSILVRVQTPNGPRQYGAEVVKSMATHDLAVIKLVSRDLFPHLPVRAPETLGGALSVTAWGDPNGIDPIQRRGTIDLTRPRVQVAAGGKAPLEDLVPTGAVFHWSQSGGPLVDRHGRLVGINVALQNAQGLVNGFAVPAEVLIRHFQDVVAFPPPVAGTAAPAAAPGTAPAAMIQAAAQAPAPAAAPPRPRRPADDWWDNARTFLRDTLGIVSQYYRGSREPAFIGGGWRDQTEALTGPGSASAGGGSSAGAAGHGPTQRVLGYPLETFLGLLLLGFVSGISGGMMTMGGGIIKVTGLMSLFGYGILLVRPVAYLTNIFMYGAAALRYRSRNLFDWEHVRPLVPWAISGVVVGYAVGIVLETSVIRWMLGLFAGLLGTKMLVEIFEKRLVEHPLLRPLALALGVGPEEASPPALGESLMRNGLLGLPMGVISGILGITGGVIEVPLQRYLAHIPLRNAIANSAVLVFFASLVGSLVAM